MAVALLFKFSRELSGKLWVEIFQQGAELDTLNDIRGMSVNVCDSFSPIASWLALEVFSQLAPTLTYISAIVRE